MAVLTKKTVFLHVGRCGGHSVGKALWISGLTEKQINPLHIRPIELAQNEQAMSKPFWFCFVRHPLQWLASVWMHAIFYGDTDPTLPAAAKLSHFLEGLMERHPDGPVTERLNDYVAASHFVGKLESLEQDLKQALNLGGEIWDERQFFVPRVNDFGSSLVKNSARAPESIWRKVLDKDREFCERFAYEDIPPGLIDDNAPVPCFFPGLQIVTASPDTLSGAIFDAPVRLPDGTNLKSLGSIGRASWQVHTALKSIGERTAKSFANLIEGDGVYSHMALTLGFGSSTGVTNVNRVSRRLLDETIGQQVTYVDVGNLDKLKNHFDVVLSKDFMDAGCPAGMISRLTDLLKPGGEILLQTVIISDLKIPVAVPLSPAISPTGPLTRFLFSWLALVNFLNGAGLSEVQIVDEFMYKSPEDQSEHGTRTELLANQLNLDPETIFTMVMIKAGFNPELAAPGLDISALNDAWFANRPLWCADPDVLYDVAPLQRLVDHLIDAQQTNEVEKAIVRGALADRETDLAAARRELVIERQKAVTAAREAERWQLATRDRETDLERERQELVALRAKVANGQTL